MNNKKVHVKKIELIKENTQENNIDEQIEKSIVTEDKIHELEKLAGQASGSKEQKTKKALVKVLFISFNVIALLVVLAYENFSDGNLIPFSTVILTLREGLLFILLATLAYMLHFFTEGYIFYALIKECGYGSRYPLGLKTAILGRCFDNLTPWSTGGQPFQMLYLYKHGIDFGTSCSLPLVKYTIRIFVVNIAVLSVLLFGDPLDSANNFIVIAAFIAVAFSFVLPVMMILFAINQKLGTKLVAFILKIASKLKLVKDYEKSLNKYVSYMDNFLSATRYLGSHKKIIIITAILSLVYIFSINSTPYFILRSLGYHDISFFNIIVLTLITVQAASYAPTPGAAGASEGVFYLVFASIVVGGYLFWALLLWRLIIYYLPIFLGFLIQIYDAIKGKVPLKVLKKMKWNNK